MIVIATIAALCISFTSSQTYTFNPVIGDRDLSDPKQDGRYESLTFDYGIRYNRVKSSYKGSGSTISANVDCSYAGLGALIEVYSVTDGIRYSSSTSRANMIDDVKRACNDRNSCPLTLKPSDYGSFNAGSSAYIFVYYYCTSPVGAVRWNEQNGAFTQEDAVDTNSNGGTISIESVALNGFISVVANLLMMASIYYCCIYKKLCCNKKKEMKFELPEEEKADDLEEVEVDVEIDVDSEKTNITK